MGTIKTDRRYLTDEELGRLSSYVRAVACSADRALFSLLCLGLRIGEVCRLMRSDVDIIGWKLTFNREKQGHPRRDTIAIPEQVRPDILLRANARLFPPDWPFIGVNRITCWKRLRRWGIAAGVPWIFPHALRHTFAVRWIDRKGSLSELQAWLGHSDPKTTTGYLRWSAGHLGSSYRHLGLGDVFTASLSDPGATVGGAPRGSDNEPKGGL